VVVENGVEFSIGDVRVRATRVEYDPRTLGFVAEGEVVFERGDETIRAARLVYDPETGMGVADEAVAVSPPFYVSGRRLERGPRGLTVRDALVAACPEGPRSELRLAAREVRFVDGRYVDVRGARPYLFGTRLFTLPRIRQPVDQGERARNQFGLALPVRAAFPAFPVWLWASPHRSLWAKTSRARRWSSCPRGMASNMRSPWSVTCCAIWTWA
jgi:hypothetical protein